MTTTYKTVFQLAQDKGYKLYQAGSITNMEDVVAANPNRQKYLDHVVYIELTLIQKWLRDEHRIKSGLHHIYDGSASFKVWTIGANTRKPNEYALAFMTAYYDMDEQALLNGVGEALKLLP